MLVLIILSSVLSVLSAPTNGILLSEYVDTTCKTPAVESTWWFNDKCVELGHIYSKATYDDKTDVVTFDGECQGVNCTNCVSVKYPAGKCHDNTTASWTALSKPDRSFYAYVYSSEGCGGEPEVVTVIEAVCETSQGIAEMIFCDQDQNLQISMWQGQTTCKGDPTYTFPYPPQCLKAGVQYELSSCKNRL